jgi:hypothetical protein
VTDLKAILELSTKVTPLPWDSDSSGVFCSNHDADGMGGEILEPHDPKTPPIGGIGRVGDPYPRGDNHPAENMRYICAACNAVPSLIQRLQAAEEENVRLRIACELKKQKSENEATDYVLILRSALMDELVKARALTPPTKSEEKR